MELLEIIIRLYVGGVIGTLILFAAGKIGVFTEKRRTSRRMDYSVSI